jgi:hypothetical protein
MDWPCSLVSTLQNETSSRAVLPAVFRETFRNRGGCCDIVTRAEPLLRVSHSPTTSVAQHLLPEAAACSVGPVIVCVGRCLEGRVTIHLPGQTEAKQDNRCAAEIPTEHLTIQVSSQCRRPSFRAQGQ